MLSWRPTGVVQGDVSRALLLARSLSELNNGIRLTTSGFEVVALRDSVSVKRLAA